MKHFKYYLFLLLLAPSFKIWAEGQSPQLLTDKQKLRLPSSSYEITSDYDGGEKIYKMKNEEGKVILLKKNPNSSLYRAVYENGKPAPGTYQIDPSVGKAYAIKGRGGVRKNVLGSNEEIEPSTSNKLGNYGKGKFSFQPLPPIASSSGVGGKKMYTAEQESAVRTIQRIYRKHLSESFPEPVKRNGEWKYPKYVQKEDGTEYYGGRTLKVSNKVLGEGAQAKVFAAKLGNQDAAIKETKIAALKLKELEPKNIDRLNDAKKKSGLPMVIPMPLQRTEKSDWVTKDKGIMPRLDKTLKDALESKKMNPTRREQLLAQREKLLEGMKLQGINQLDPNGGNAMLDKKGNLHIIDFGVVKFENPSLDPVPESNSVKKDKLSLALDSYNVIPAYDKGERVFKTKAKKGGRTILLKKNPNSPLYRAVYENGKPAPGTYRIDPSVGKAYAVKGRGGAASGSTGGGGSGSSGSSEMIKSSDLDEAQEDPGFYQLKNVYLDGKKYKVISYLDDRQPNVFSEDGERVEEYRLTRAVRRVFHQEGGQLIRQREANGTIVQFSEEDPIIIGKTRYKISRDGNVYQYGDEGKEERDIEIRRIVKKKYAARSGITELVIEPKLPRGNNTDSEDDGFKDLDEIENERYFRQIVGANGWGSARSVEAFLKDKIVDDEDRFDLKKFASEDEDGDEEDPEFIKRKMNQMIREGELKRIENEEEQEERQRERLSRREKLNQRKKEAQEQYEKDIERYKQLRAEYEKKKGDYEAYKKELEEIRKYNDQARENNEQVEKDIAENEKIREHNARLKEDYEAKLAKYESETKNLKGEIEEYEKKSREYNKKRKQYLLGAGYNLASAEQNKKQGGGPSYDKMVKGYKQGKKSGIEAYNREVSKKNKKIIGENAKSEKLYEEKKKKVEEEQKAWEKYLKDLADVEKENEEIEKDRKRYQKYEANKSKQPMIYKEGEDEEIEKAALRVKYTEQRKSLINKFNPRAQDMFVSELYNKGIDPTLPEFEDEGVKIDFDLRTPRPQDHIDPKTSGVNIDLETGIVTLKKSPVRDMSLSGVVATIGPVLRLSEAIKKSPTMSSKKKEYASLGVKQIAEKTRLAEEKRKKRIEDAGRANPRILPPDYQERLKSPEFQDDNSVSKRLGLNLGKADAMVQTSAAAKVISGASVAKQGSGVRIGAGVKDNIQIPPVHERPILSDEQILKLIQKETPGVSYTKEEMTLHRQNFYQWYNASFEETTEKAIRVGMFENTPSRINFTMVKYDPENDPSIILPGKVLEKKPLPKAPKKPSKLPQKKDPRQMLTRMKDHTDHPGPKPIGPENMPVRPTPFTPLSEIQVGKEMQLVDEPEEIQDSEEIDPLKRPLILNEEEEEEEIEEEAKKYRYKMKYAEVHDDEVDLDEIRVKKRTKSPEPSLTLRPHQSATSAKMRTSTDGRIVATVNYGHKSKEVIVDLSKKGGHQRYFQHVVAPSLRKRTIQEEFLKKKYQSIMNGEYEEHASISRFHSKTDYVTHAEADEVGFTESQRKEINSHFALLNSNSISTSIANPVRKILKLEGGMLPAKNHKYSSIEGKLQRIIDGGTSGPHDPWSGSYLIKRNAMKGRHVITQVQTFDRKLRSGDFKNEEEAKKYIDEDMEDLSFSEKIKLKKVARMEFKSLAKRPSSVPIPEPEYESSKKPLKPKIDSYMPYSYGIYGSPTEFSHKTDIMASEASDARESYDEYVKRKELGYVKRKELELGSLVSLNDREKKIFKMDEDIFKKYDKILKPHRKMIEESKKISQGNITPIEESERLGREHKNSQDALMDEFRNSGLIHDGILSKDISEGEKKYVINELKNVKKITVPDEKKLGNKYYDIQDVTRDYGDQDKTNVDKVNFLVEDVHRRKQREEEIEKLRMQLSQLEGKRKKYAPNDPEIRDIEKKIIDHKALIGELESKDDDLFNQEQEKQVRRLREEFAAKKAEYDVTYNKSSSKIKELEESIRKKQERQKFLQKQEKIFSEKLNQEEEVRQRLVHLREELREAEQERQKFDVEYKILRSKIKNDKSKIEELEPELDEADGELYKKKSKVNRIHYNISTVEIELKKMEDDLRFVKNLRKDLDKKETEIDKTMSSLKGKEKERFQNLEAKRKELEKLNTGIQEQIQESDKEKTASLYFVKKEVEKKRYEVEQAKEELDEVVQQARPSNKGKKPSLQKEINSKKENLQRKLNELAKAEARLRELPKKATGDSYSVDLEMLRASAQFGHDAKKDLEDLEMNLEYTMGNRKKELREQWSKKFGENPLKDTQKKIEELQIQLLRTQGDSEKDVLARLDQAKENISLKINQLNLEIEDKNKEIDELKQEMKKTRDQLKEMDPDGKIIEKNIVIQTKGSERSRREIEIEAMEEERSALLKEIESLKTRFSDENKELGKVGAKYKKLIDKQNLLKLRSIKKVKLNRKRLAEIDNDPNINAYQKLKEHFQEKMESLPGGSAQRLKMAGLLIQFRKAVENPETAYYAYKRMPSLMKEYKQIETEYDSKEGRIQTREWRKMIDNPDSYRDIANKMVEREKLLNDVEQNEKKNQEIEEEIANNEKKLENLQKEKKQKILALRERKGEIEGKEKRIKEIDKQVERNKIIVTRLTEEISKMKNLGGDLEIEKLSRRLQDLQESIAQSENIKKELVESKNELIYKKKDIEKKQERPDMLSEKGIEDRLSLLRKLKQLEETNTLGRLEDLERERFKLARKLEFLDKRSLISKQYRERSLEDVKKQAGIMKLAINLEIKGFIRRDLENLLKQKRIKNLREIIEERYGSQLGESEEKKAFLTKLSDLDKYRSDSEAQELEEREATLLRYSEIEEKITKKRTRRLNLLKQKNTKVEELEKIDQDIEELEAEKERLDAQRRQKMAELESQIREKDDEIERLARKTKGQNLDDFSSVEEKIKTLKLVEIQGEIEEIEEAEEKTPMMQRKLVALKEEKEALEEGKDIKEIENARKRKETTVRETEIVEEKINALKGRKELVQEKVKTSSKAEKSKYQTELKNIETTLALLQKKKEALKIKDQKSEIALKNIKKKRQEEYAKTEKGALESIENFKKAMRIAWDAKEGESEKIKKITDLINTLPNKKRREEGRNLINRLNDIRNADEGSSTSGDGFFKTREINKWRSFKRLFVTNRTYELSRKVREAKVFSTEDRRKALDKLFVDINSFYQKTLGYEQTTPLYSSPDQFYDEMVSNPEYEIEQKKKLTFLDENLDRAIQTLRTGKVGNPKIIEQLDPDLHREYIALWGQYARSNNDQERGEIESKLRDLSKKQGLRTLPERKESLQNALSTSLKNILNKNITLGELENLRLGGDFLTSSQQEKMKHDLKQIHMVIEDPDLTEQEKARRIKKLKINLSKNMNEYTQDLTVRALRRNRPQEGQSEDDKMHAELGTKYYNTNTSKNLSNLNLIALGAGASIDEDTRRGLEAQLYDTDDLRKKQDKIIQLESKLKQLENELESVKPWYRNKNDRTLLKEEGLDAFSRNFSEKLSISPSESKLKEELRLRLQEELGNARAEVVEMYKTMKQGRNSEKVSYLIKENDLPENLTEENKKKVIETLKRITLSAANIKAANQAREDGGSLDGKRMTEEEIEDYIKVEMEKQQNMRLEIKRAAIEGARDEDKEKATRDVRRNLSDFNDVMNDWNNPNWEKEAEEIRNKLKGKISKEEMKTLERLTGTKKILESQLKKKIGSKELAKDQDVNLKRFREQLKQTEGFGTSTFVQDPQYRTTMRQKIRVMEEAVMNRVPLSKISIPKELGPEQTKKIKYHLGKLEKYVNNKITNDGSETSGKVKSVFLAALVGREADQMAPIREKVIKETREELRRFAHDITKDPIDPDPYDPRIPPSLPENSAKIIDHWESGGTGFLAEEDFEEQMARLSQEIDGLDRDRQELEEEMENLDGGQLSRMRLRFFQLERNMKKVKLDNENLKKEKERLAGKLQDMEYDKRASLVKRDALMKKEEEMRRKISEFKRNEMKVQERLNSLRVQRAQSILEILKNNKLSDQEITDVEKRLKSKGMPQQFIQETVSFLRGGRKTLPRHMEQILGKFDLEGEFLDMLEKVDPKRKESLSKINRDIESFERQEEMITNHKKKVESEMPLIKERLRKEIEKSKKKLENFDRDREEILANMRELDARIIKNEQKQRTLQTERAQLEREIDQMEQSDERKRLRAKIDEINNEIAKKKAEMEKDDKAKLKQKQEELSEVQKEIKKLRNQIDELDENSSKSKGEELEKMTREKFNLITKHSLAVDDEENIKEEIERLKRQIETREQVKKRREQIVEENKENLKKKQQEYDELNAKLEDLNGRILNQEDGIKKQDLENDREEISAKLSRLRDDIENLGAEASASLKSKSLDGPDEEEDEEEDDHIFRAKKKNGRLKAAIFDSPEEAIADKESKLKKWKIEEQGIQQGIKKLKEKSSKGPLTGEEKKELNSLEKKRAKLVLDQSSATEDIQDIKKLNEKKSESSEQKMLVESYDKYVSRIEDQEGDLSDTDQKRLDQLKKSRQRAEESRQRAESETKRIQDRIGKRNGGDFKGFIYSDDDDGGGGGRMPSKAYSSQKGKLLLANSAKSSAADLAIIFAPGAVGAAGPGADDDQVATSMPAFGTMLAAAVGSVAMYALSSTLLSSVGGLMVPVMEPMRNFAQDLESLEEDIFSNTEPALVQSKNSNSGGYVFNNSNLQYGGSESVVSQEEVENKGVPQDRLQDRSTYRELYNPGGSTTQYFPAARAEKHIGYLGNEVAFQKKHVDYLWGLMSTIAAATRQTSHAIDMPDVIQDRYMDILRISRERSKLSNAIHKKVAPHITTANGYAVTMENMDF